jgi:hypothetical protein
MAAQVFDDGTNLLERDTYYYIRTADDMDPHHRELKTVHPMTCLPEGRHVSQFRIRRPLIWVLLVMIIGALILLRVENAKAGNFASRPVSTNLSPARDASTSAQFNCSACINQQVVLSAQTSSDEASLASVPDLGWYPSQQCEKALFRDYPTLGEMHECGKHNATQDMRVELVTDFHRWQFTDVGNQGSWQPGRPFDLRASSQPILQQSSGKLYMTSNSSILETRPCTRPCVICCI